MSNFIIFCIAYNIVSVIAIVWLMMLTHFETDANKYERYIKMAMSLGAMMSGLDVIAALVKG